MIGGLTASISEVLYRLKIVDTVTRYPTRQLVFMDTINILSDLKLFVALFPINFSYLYLPY